MKVTGSFIAWAFTKIQQGIEIDQQQQNGQLSTLKLSSQIQCYFSGSFLAWPSEPLYHWKFPNLYKKKTRLIQNEVFLLTKIKYDINIAFCKVIKTASYLYLMSC